MKYHSESGNALIYVLVAIVLFAALSFSLTRQTDTDEAGYLSGDKAELYASEIISYAAAAKSTVDQMMFTGSTIDDLDFILPSDAAFDTGSHIHKVFHPLGGGLNYRSLRSEMVTNTEGGVYVVKKDIEWTETSAADVMLSFYRLDYNICQKLADKIDGNMATYSGGSLRDIFTDQSNPATLTATFCPNCENQFSYVVGNSTIETCNFYTILADR